MAVAGRILQVVADYRCFNVENASVPSIGGREWQVVADHRSRP
jgi:hypothetical protein